MTTARAPKKTNERKGRREAILAAATRLFRERGFHQTGMDDIGFAVGITGPGLYRHFRSKHDLLAAVLERGMEQAEAAVEEARADTSSPRETLERFVDAAIGQAIEERGLHAIMSQELQNLPPKDRRRMSRAGHHLFEEWVRTLTKVRTDLSVAEAAAALYAVNGMILGFIRHDSGMDAPRQHAMLRRMVLAALLAE